MSVKPWMRSAIGWGAATGIGVAAASYATCVAMAWARYGKASRTMPSEEADTLLDRFMPVYDVVEHHAVRVAAPPEMALAAAADMDLEQSVIVRALFRARALILGSEPDHSGHPRTLLAQARDLGWGVLAELPGREIVLGAATRPWMANVVFQALLPDEFMAFQEPSYVKIAWTLRADPMGAAECVFRTETRVVTTDASARAAFRRYWAFFSPGIVLIRRVSMRLVKAEAERRARRDTVSS